MLQKWKKHFSKTEHGWMVDQLGALLVILFVCAILVAFIQYSKLVEIKLSCDNIGKKYLYQMEQMGYMTAEDKQNMKNELANALDLTEAQKNSITFSGVGTNGVQVSYGGRVELICNVTFSNPMAENFGTMFAPEMSYQINMSATSKW